MLHRIIYEMQQLFKARGLFLLMALVVPMYLLFLFSIIRGTGINYEAAVLVLMTWGLLVLIAGLVSIWKKQGKSGTCSARATSEGIAGLFTSIRWKIIFAFVISLFLAVLTTIILLAAASILARLYIFGGLLSLLNNTLGAMPIIILTACFLFIVYFFLITQRSIRYIEEVSGALNKIANGRFDIRVVVRSSDELGNLAENINRMAEQINNSIEEERNAERTKNELITGVSHDLRTPLTSILGYLGLIVNDRYKDEVELRYYVDIAYAKTLRLKKLIDDLFEFTKLSSEGIKLVCNRVNLGELLEQLAEEFVPVLDESDMKYRLNLPKEKVFVNADGDMMVRVFENLIVNAIRYGQEGKYVDIELVKEGNSAVVRVINYGEPIPENELPYIFDKFYRVEKSRSLKTGGAGLGLAIAKSIVELHGGQIAAFSRQDRTAFEVRLKLIW